MTRNTQQRSPLLPLVLFAFTAFMATGCTTLKVPALAFSKPETPEYGRFGAGPELEPSTSEKAYHSVRQARSQNAIVLQVAGDSTPVRVLPLPPGQKSVYVSDLLKQTGVQKKLGSVEATLYRYSPDSIGGLQMAVKMSPNGQSVRAVSDYALHAGDRLMVSKAPNPALKGLVSMVLGI